MGCLRGVVGALFRGFIVVCGLFEVILREIVAFEYAASGRAGEVSLA